MRRAFALCAATGIALSALAVAGPAKASPYYLIRYDNTGYCQIWNQSFSFKPWTWPSAYKAVGKPVPTVTEALALKDGLMKKGTCLR
jgi:hypothetical protein